MTKFLDYNTFAAFENLYHFSIKLSDKHFNDDTNQEFLDGLFNGMKKMRTLKIFNYNVQPSSYT
jgi:hypothetical protein